MSEKKRPGKVQFWKRLTKAEQKALRGGDHGGSSSSASSSSGAGGGGTAGR